MNRFYLIVPVVLLALFGGVYWQHNRSAAADARQKAAAVALAKEADESKKQAAEAKAREDAAQRTAARLADEQKKEQEKQDRWEAEGLRIAEDTARDTGKAASLAGSVAEREKELAALRSARDTVNHEAFELARQVELARIQKRNAELEVQRLTEMIARKVANTSLVSAAP
jgi:hypothetical protein